ncbi:TM0106 family RecB-like putative nuclease [Mycolicibacterium celeriflavum]|uniref:ATPase n=1 Tax=Mycolicibacterium celeriflavum TaxID=1249101 RepID=A0A1X0BXY2_MYCCF|nr:TM0106 family RecB-like putative nuclease [Mycolicibacterium celeriflavum]MCV7238702.1 TM0106 family RecB-like putative nuclease [Mycolicibacterium celeriflavum]ORA48516.1 nuclease [Mycolicibacterium celeriflavum]BBY46270.1 ATPase [Mycolicibacterium celeriflavum]
MFVASQGAEIRVIYSASDLAAAARCEYALLRAFDAKLGRGPDVAVADELLARTAQLGDEHEQRHLDQLRDRADVAIIGRPPYTVEGLTAAAEQTRRAVERRAQVIYQAAMFDGRFVGFADFLIFDGERYRLRDTKLARSVKVEALLQLAAYAETLAAAGVPVAEEVELVLGDGATATYRVDELLPVYRPRRDALQRLLDDHFASGAPVDWADETVRACFRCPECEVQVRANDDLLLVANMRVSQRARLLDAGITTVAELAQHEGPVAELPARTVASLSAQARLQLAPRVDGKPPYEVADAQPLKLLPDPDRGDLFFDFEGDPLWTADGHEWGLEYMWGVLEAGGAFRPLWAHDRASERKALLDFLKLVRQRRKRFPKMHIYHYAAYEKTALLRLAGRYGVGEDEVDDLLRSGVLVDLYPLVRKSIRVGTENYSLKSLEPLYMGAELRSGDVTTATESITMYARFCELRAEGRHDEAANMLKQIEDYNRYDCRSTHRLRDWLIKIAIESSVPPLGPQPVADGVAVEDTDQLARTLTEFAGDGVTQRSPEQTAVALMAAARGYHRREDKPFWWAHFDRLNNPVDEWGDTSDVFLVDTDGATLVKDWHLPSTRARKQQRWVTLTGALESGGLNKEVFALYEPPSPAGMADNTDRRAAGNADVIDVDDGNVPTRVVICERETQAGTFTQMPFALTPRNVVGTKKQREAIDAAAAEMAAALPDLPRTAVVDILLRRPPRTRSGAPVPHTGDVTDDITAALLDLDSSYLAVHGPPGTGKTYTAARIIARLVNEHQWRVGVVAQSHAVVENLFRDLVQADVDPARIAKKDCPADVGCQAIDKDEYAAFIAAHAGCVIGGTAWDFANDTRVDAHSLDLLVIEEAGQFCLANTIAVARAADNLMLLGDPQQLPQVSQGHHPEPVDASALGWLVQENRTLSEELGYFLDRSYRMHPAVCAAVSRLAYEGRLLPAESGPAERRLEGQHPGVRVVSIAHDGNSTSSPEEADAIVAAIQALLGGDWTDEDGTRPLTQADVLVVAPYNAQVMLLRERFDAVGLPDVSVGTVDKFQGRQAPVVFVSMTASSIDDVPRGISFLLNRNRLNVAISRAKYLSVIVRSETLTEYLPSTPDRLIELGAFLSLSPCDTPTA